MNERAQAVIDYWFEGFKDVDQAKGSENPFKKWFRGGEAVDQEIKQLFSQDIEKAMAGDYDDWVSEPESCLALLLILDQFTRNIYRGTAQAHAADEKAQKITLEALEKMFDDKLSYVQRVFMYMPLMHAEDIALQEKCVNLFDQLVTESEINSAHNSFIFENNLKYAREHRDVIVRFGRFPYRNEYLGRENTPEEKEFLAARNKK